MTDHDLTPVPDRPRTPAGRALATVVLALLAASVLCADGLERTASGQPYGWQRTVGLALVHPVQEVSHATRLDQPRRWLAALTGHRDPVVELDTRSVVTSPPTTTPTTRPPPIEIAATLPGLGSVPSGLPTTTTTTTTRPATTTTTTPMLRFRTPSPDDPVRVWVGGDSLAGNLGDSLTKVLRDAPATVHKDARVGTGLARPDVVNWAAELPGALTGDPEVVILVFGANDDQPLHVPGHGYRLGTDDWRAEYQRRVAQLLNEASRFGRTLIWVGLPAVEPPLLETSRRVMNEVAKTEADARPDVEFFDPSPVLTPDGTYRQFDGVTQIREADGVHSTHAGSDRVAARLVDVFAESRHLR